MKQQQSATILDEITLQTHSRASGPCIGHIAGVDGDGRILVRHGQEPSRPARLVAPLKRYELTSPAYLGREVLLNFEHGDPARPIIVALMADPMEDLLSLEVKENEEQRQIRVDGQTINIDARDEILLTCGLGSIRLTKDGKIILKGIEIVSRAKEANKIKGAKVEVN